MARTEPFAHLLPETGYFAFQTIFQLDDHALQVLHRVFSVAHDVKMDSTANSNTVTKERRREIAKKLPDYFAEADKSHNGEFEEEAEAIFFDGVPGVRSNYQQIT